MIRRLPTSTPFPYTTLFRSLAERRRRPLILVDEHLAQTRQVELEELLRVGARARHRSEEHTSELQSQSNLVCRLLLEQQKLEKKKNKSPINSTRSVHLLISY